MLLRSQRSLLVRVVSILDRGKKINKKQNFILISPPSAPNLGDASLRGIGMMANTFTGKYNLDELLFKSCVSSRAPELFNSVPKILVITI